jgi:hypothetical protein
LRRQESNLYPELPRGVVAMREIKVPEYFTAGSRSGHDPEYLECELRALI